MSAAKTHELPLLASLFGIGAVIAVAHIAVSLELSVSLGYHTSLVRTLILLLYPLGVATTGVGAVLEPRLACDTVLPPKAWIRAAGGALAALLLASLRVNFFTASLPALAAAVVATSVPLVAWFLLVGAATARMLRAARVQGRRLTSLAWACHLAGLTTGYLVVDGLVHGFGANALLAIIGLAMVISPRVYVLALPVLLVVPLPGGQLDRLLERHRDLGALEERLVQPAPDRTGNREPAWNQALAFGDEGWETVFQGWSRFANVCIQRRDSPDGRPILRGFHNYVYQWVSVPAAFGWRTGLDQARAVFYGLARPDDRILVLGAGAGRGARELGFELTRRVTLVERDEAVVRFLRDERPDLNDALFTKTTVVAHDARFALEQSQAAFDFIVVESARFTPARLGDPVGAADSLYTREAVDLYHRRLTPDGLLLLSFNQVAAVAEEEYHPLQVRRSLSALGIPHRAFAVQAGATRHVFLVAARADAVLARAWQKLAASGAGDPSAAVDDAAPLSLDEWTPATPADKRHRRLLTDARPFAGWARSGDKTRNLVLAVTSSLAALLLAGLLALVRSAAGRALGPRLPFFFLIGLGQTTVQMATAFAFRSFLGDAVITTTHLLVYFLLFGALGALAATWIARTRRSLFAWAGVALVVAIHPLVLHVIPFESPLGLAGRELCAALLVLPAATCTGLFFPFGLLASKDGSVGLALLADALGTLCGYLSFFMLYLPFGGDAFVVSGIVAYFAALLVLRPWSLARRFPS